MKDVFTVGSLELPIRVGMPKVSIGRIRNYPRHPELEGTVVIAVAVLDSSLNLGIRISEQGNGCQELFKGNITKGGEVLPITNRQPFSSVSEVREIDPVSINFKRFKYSKFAV